MSRTVANNDEYVVEPAGAFTIMHPAVNRPFMYMSEINEFFPKLDLSEQKLPTLVSVPWLMQQVAAGVEVVASVNGKEVVFDPKIHLGWKRQASSAFTLLMNQKFGALAHLAEAVVSEGKIIYQYDLGARINGTITGYTPYGVPNGTFSAQIACVAKHEGTYYTFVRPQLRQFRDPKTLKHGGAILTCVGGFNAGASNAWEEIAQELAIKKGQLIETGFVGADRAWTTEGDITFICLFETENLEQLHVDKTEHEKWLGGRIAIPIEKMPMQLDWQVSGCITNARNWLKWKGMI